MNTLLGIERDIFNCSAVVEKYFVFLDMFRARKDPLIANLVLTDVEFLFSNIRSLYDSLQFLTADILRRSDVCKSANLPRSFADLAKLEKEELRQKYRLPEPLMQFYIDTKNFFVACREIRGGFQHQRIDITVLYCLDEGFALQKETPFFEDPVVARFNIWPSRKIKEGVLVSLLALIAFLNSAVIAHTDALSNALETSFTQPQPIVKDYLAFL